MCTLWELIELRALHGRFVLANGKQIKVTAFVPQVKHSTRASHNWLTWTESHSNEHWYKKSHFSIQVWLLLKQDECESAGLRMFILTFSAVYECRLINAERHISCVYRYQRILPTLWKITPIWRYSRLLFLFILLKYPCWSSCYLKFICCLV